MDNLMNANPRPRYSFILPVFNEEEVLPALFERMNTQLTRLGESSEVILVDDGSLDSSFEQIQRMARQDPRYKAIQFSRNFGHQIAITAGMDLARGDAVIVMDADLQDPPEVVDQMIARWRQGYEVVYAVRTAREGENWFKRGTASLFYRILRRLTDVDMPVDAGDFRLIDRKVLLAFRSMRENNRYVRGMFSWVGFRQIGVPYSRSERFAGETKYPLAKMLRLAANGIVSFSDLPLRLALNVGFLVSALSFIAGVAAIIAKVGGFRTVPGWASMTVVTSFLGGIQLMVIGVLGEYIGRIHEEVKARPLYIIRETAGFDASPEAGGAI